MSVIKSKIIIGILVFLIFINVVNAIPSSFNWNKKNESGEIKNYMTRVRNQGYCDSCWAHAVLGVIEAQHNIAKHKPNINIDLSEQYLVSDCYKYGACCGLSKLYLNGVLAYIKNHGVPNETCFPYEDDWGCTCVSGSCGTDCTYRTDKFSNCSDYICSNACPDVDNNIYRITGYKHLSNDKDVIKNYIYTTGPIAVDVYWPGIKVGDIYTCENDTGSGIWHAVVITGYDETDNYWIVKNSRGAGWGDKGYFKVGFDECSIQEYAYGVNVPQSDIEDVDSKTFTIYNNGDRILEIENIEADVSWVSNISKNKFIILQGESEVINVTVDGGGFNSGRDDGNIIITSNDLDEHELRIPITLVSKEPEEPDSSVIPYVFTGGGGTETNYIRIPKNATIISASLQIKEVF